MRDANATTRIQNLFVQYHTILLRNGLSWIIKDKQKVAFYHFLSAISLATLQTRLKSDLYFSNYDLRRDFKGFLKHAIPLFEAFELVYNGNTASSPSFSSTRKKGNRGDNR